mmetsp:Transcript_18439/g.46054  ORF Transcript_18439/g.46054 Transcript_18439/m.46054 type:complete len:333 (-) Transcript_18439:334-1332(-)
MLPVVSGKQDLLSSFEPWSIFAMAPTRVPIPMSVTRPCAFPHVTVQDENAMEGGVSFSSPPWPSSDASEARSAVDTFFLGTSSGSPVRSISFTFSSLLSRMRRSAGTMSPTLSTTTSPTTTFRLSISTSAPSRITVHVACDIFDNASSAWLAADSVTAAMPAFRNTITKIAMPSTKWMASGFLRVAAMIKDAQAEAVRSSMITFSICAMKSMNSVGGLGLYSSLGPSRASFSAALAAVTPLVTEVSSSSSSLETSQLCHPRGSDIPYGAMKNDGSRFVTLFAPLRVLHTTVGSTYLHLGVQVSKPRYRRFVESSWLVSEDCFKLQTQVFVPA